MRMQIIFMTFFTSIIVSFSFAGIEGKVLAIQTDMEEEFSCFAEQNNDFLFIKIKRKSDGEERWFTVDFDNKQAMSVALTAMTTGLKIIYDEGTWNSCGGLNVYSLKRLQLTGNPVDF